ncbi:MAG: peptide deformylase [Sutterella wadsworthensis]|nr:peptide deformylase [Sutterella wadsworthensis]
MIRPVMRMGEPVLMQKAVSVTDFESPALHQLVADMWDTMDAEGGIGIAAPQIGVSQQIVCFGTYESECAKGALHVPRTVLINPIIEPVGDEVIDHWEGCLSVPGLRGVVTRSIAVRYRGLDLEGNQIDRTVDGLHARVVQHECDHLKGILYPMRVTDWTRFGYQDVFFRKKG